MSSAEMREFEAELREFEEMVKNIDFKPPYLGSEGSWEWSDGAVGEKFKSPWVTYLPPSEAVSKAVYSKFLCCILGDLSNVTDVVDLMTKVILLTPDPEDNSNFLFTTIFSPTATEEIYKVELVSAEGASYSKCSRHVTEKFDKALAYEKAAPLEMARFKRGEKKVDPKTRVEQNLRDASSAATTKDKAQFDIETIWKALQENPPTERTLVAKQMLSFMALVCTRLCVDNVSQVWKYFQTRASKAFVETCNPVGLPISLPVPATDLFIQISDTFPKGSSRHQKLFYYLVGARYAFDNKSAGKEYAANSRLRCRYMDEGCLLHLKLNGLGLMTLLLKACREACCSPSWLVEAAFDSPFEQSINLITEFLVKFHKKDQVEITWQWARLIDDNFFKNMALRRHLVMGSRFAALCVEASGETGVWNMAAFERLSDGQKTAATKWAKEVMAHCRPPKGQRRLHSPGNSEGSCQVQEAQSSSSSPWEL